MLIMAHPDDAEFGAGGLMTYWHRAGHPIKILCLTNGNAGHHQLNPPTSKLVFASIRAIIRRPNYQGAR